jgi:hypothetical protein
LKCRGSGALVIVRIPESLGGERLVMVVALLLAIVKRTVRILQFALVLAIRVVVGCARSVIRGDLITILMVLVMGMEGVAVLEMESLNSVL